MSIFHTMGNRVRSLGVGGALDFAVGRSLHKIARGPLRRLSRPSLSEIVESASVLTRTANDSLAELCPQLVGDATRLQELSAEYESVVHALEQRYKDTALPCPTIWGMGTESARLLYLYVRLAKPQRVFETGVANGHSSYILLSALEANGSGALWSVDVLSDAGSLVPESLRSRWHLVIAKLDRARADLRSGLDDATPVDLFIHDSQHTWLWQTLEFDEAQRVLADGGILASDDVDKSYAWIDWCATRHARNLILVDGPKAFGALLVSDLVRRS